MTYSQQSVFWESIPDNLRDAIRYAVPAQMIEEKLSLSTGSETLADKYTQLESFLEDRAEQETYDKQLSNRQAVLDQSTTSPHFSALFPLAMLQTEMKHYGAAEKSWRSLTSANDSSRPDIAALSNLIEVLNLQHKYIEAQSLSTKTLPLLWDTLGKNSPQSLGCMRKLIKSFVGQNKRKEARQLHQQGIELVATMSDGDTKQAEADAMQELGREIDLLD